MKAQVHKQAHNLHTCIPCKQARSNPETFWLRPVMAIMVSAHPVLGRIVSRIRFSSIFPKKAWIILCQTDQVPIWMAWSGFGQTHLVWKQAGVQESSGPVSGRTQPVHYRFPTFRLGSVLPQTSRIILSKTRPDLIKFWLCQVLAKQIRSGSKPVCRNHRARFLAGRRQPATSFPF